MKDMDFLLGRLSDPAILVTEQGDISLVNEAACQLLAMSPKLMTAKRFAEVVALPGFDEAQTLKRTPGDKTHKGPFPATIRRSDGHPTAVLVTLLWYGSDVAGAWLCLLPKARHSGKADNEEILQCMIEASSEAMWCIEFDEAIDVTASRADVIRQVFETPCHWTQCNSAMARIYNLPDGIDLNHEPVSRFFARSAENERFIGQLFDSDFSIDNVPSCDFRHDGTPVYLENTVRCHIDEHGLWRMIGTVRDLSSFKRAEIALVKREESMRDVLGAISDAVIVVDAQLNLTAANPAFATLFNVAIDGFLGQNVSHLIDLSPHLRRSRTGTTTPFAITGYPENRPAIVCEATLAPLQDNFKERFVAVLRANPDEPDTVPVP